MDGYKILEAREKRAELIKFLTKNYDSSVVALRVNYPGNNKDNETTRQIVQFVKGDILNILKIKCDIDLQMETINAEGPAAIFVVKGTPLKIKKICIEYEENSILGRCVDIDVYDNDGKGIGRSELGYGMRKCFLCDDDAHNCVRSRKHNLNEIIEYIDARLDEYMEKSHERKR